eukprot:TRINITY_DN709_c6_g1_i2.p1 TRINITY_DN709_c6_g1~~TRINITY_DN709_c6_g1_i2.p1  ORF type:complete len:181 (+),score=44.39 TRINITY_DN709_c6_g1_i2:248-790(+)
MVPSVSAIVRIESKRNVSLCVEDNRRKQSDDTAKCEAIYLCRMCGRTSTPPALKVSSSLAIKKRKRDTEADSNQVRKKSKVSNLVTVKGNNTPKVNSDGSQKDLSSNKTYPKEQKKGQQNAKKSQGQSSVKASNTDKGDTKKKSKSSSLIKGMIQKQQQQQQQQASNQQFDLSQFLKPFK